MSSEMVAIENDSMQLVRDAGKVAAGSAVKASPKKAILAVLFTLVTGAALIGGMMMWRYSNAHESTDDAYVDGNITQISSRISGTVSRVLVEDNQYVKAGQTLVVLDPRDYKVKIAQARAALAKAQRQSEEDSAAVAVTSSTASAQQITTASDKLHVLAAIKDASASKTAAVAALGIEQAKLVSLEAQQKQNAVDLSRYSNLYAQGAVSRQQFDQAKMQNDVALAQLDAERRAIEQARANVSRADAALQQVFSDEKKTRAGDMTAAADLAQTNVKHYQTKVSQAAVDQAKADLQSALLQESYTTIVAPVSGRIGKKSVQPGEQINLGQQLFSIIPSNSWVTANFKETQLARIRPHESVDIVIDAYPDHHFKGRIDSLSPASGNEFALLPADNATGNFTKIVQRVPIKIIFDQTSIAAYKALVIPGLSAQVNVSLN